MIRVDNFFCCLRLEIGGGCQITVKIIHSLTWFACVWVQLIHLWFISIGYVIAVCTLLWNIAVALTVVSSFGLLLYFNCDDFRNYLINEESILHNTTMISELDQTTFMRYCQSSKGGEFIVVQCIVRQSSVIIKIFFFAYVFPSHFRHLLPLHRHIAMVFLSRLQVYTRRQKG